MTNSMHSVRAGAVGGTGADAPGMIRGRGRVPDAGARGLLSAGKHAASLLARVVAALVTLVVVLLAIIPFLIIVVALRLRPIEYD